MSWREVQLGDGLHVKHGFAFKGEYFAAFGEYMVLTPGNFLEKGGFRVRDGKERFYRADFPDEYLLTEGDLIVAMTEQGEGLLGSAARIPDEGKYLHNQRLGLVQITDPQLLDKRFLYWAFNSANVRGQIRASATGTKVKHTAPERIKKVRLKVPALASQQAIALVLDSYDNLIATNQRRIALLEEAARRLYREWFVYLRFPGHEQVLVQDGVPVGWSIQPLASVAEVNARSVGARDKPDSLWYIDISSVSTGLIHSTTPYAFAEAPGRARRRVIHGDVIWSCVRPNRRSYALIWEPDENLVASTGFAVLSATAVPFSYLYFTSTTDAFVGHLEQNATGAAYPAVTAKIFEDAEILVPDGDVTAAFDQMVLPQLELMETLKQQNHHLTQARDLLLPKLMSGQLDVSGIPLPEEIAA
ncbi:MAG: restriction endonuclease subunit S [Proteobacteria bacterium]|nr:restriction endonuclease subunit S [Pseudomonadota bacterium]MBS0495295.1 restriction endonuclease subunit S [Pseudomonadota bacterium]